MKTTIFYFSTTGNSLALARSLGEGLGGATLVSIPKVLGTKSSNQSDRVGFVFPVYAWGPPRIVTQFVKELRLQGKPYVFAVATCGGTPGRTLLELRGLLRRAGADLHAGFVCPGPSNTVTGDPGFVRAVRRVGRVNAAPGSQRLPEMLQVIGTQQSHKMETSPPAGNLLCGTLRAMMGMAAAQMKNIDSKYSVDEHCIGCGTCTRLCPRANITLQEGRPQWHHDCEMCNACIQWCPKQAIHMAGECSRYRNPAIHAEDLLLR